MSTKYRLIGLWILALLAAGCECGGDARETASAAVASEEESIAILLNWFPEAEHGGFYAAASDDHAPPLELRAGRPDVPVIAQVGMGRIPFGVANAAEVLMGRAEGVPVVALSAGLQHNPRCIMVRDEARFQSIRDLRNVELAMNISEPFASFVDELALENIRVIPYTGSVAPFLASEAMTQQAYSFSEPFLAQERGAQVRCLMVSELDFDPYAQLLITNEDELRQRPERARQLASRVAAGWERYVSAPDEVNATIAELNDEMTPEALAFGARALAPLVRQEGAEVGSMNLERWEALREAMIRVGLLDDDAPPAEDAFVNP